MVSRLQWIVNPFRRIAGFEALLAGLGFMVLSALIAWKSGTHFDGVLDSHTGSLRSPAWVYFAEPLIDWACAVAVFALVARFGSATRFRIVDLAGTLALCRAPMLLAAVLGFAVPARIDPFHPDPLMLVLAIPMLGIAVWTVVLMYHAFKVSVNPKPARAVLLFSVGVIVAEILSKILLHFFYINLVP